jgi:hypothetical protein
MSRKYDKEFKLNAVNFGTRETNNVYPNKPRSRDRAINVAEMGKRV